MADVKPPVLHLAAVASLPEPDEPGCDALLPLGGLVPARPVDGWVHVGAGRMPKHDDANYFNTYAPRFLHLLKEGYNKRNAAALVGMSYTIAQQWIDGAVVTEHNPDPPPHLVAFSQAVAAIEALHEKRYLDVVEAAAKGDKNVNYKAAAFMLRCRFREHYGDDVRSDAQQAARIVVIDARDADESTLGRTEYDSDNET